MDQTRTNATLRDLGERGILERLIAPRFGCNMPGFIGIGDDCAVIPAPMPGHSLVFTTDPCPVPVVCILESPNLYHYGWLTVLINLSDLAAMGAHPLGLLVSTVMSETMASSDYEQFLDGLSDASSRWECPILGGNIKDGLEFTAAGSALGVVATDQIMLRSGASPGDRVFVIGDMGLFWAACLTRICSINDLEQRYVNELNRALYQPVARIREGIALAKSQSVTSCMDSSDGVIGCLQELALRSKVDIVIDTQLLRPPASVQAVADVTGIDVRKLMLSWGDWQLVCTVRPQFADKISELMQSLGTPWADIGLVQSGRGLVYLRERDQRNEITNFSNERFSSTSFFTHGLDAYIEALRQKPLTTKGTPSTAP